MAKKKTSTSTARAAKKKAPAKKAAAKKTASSKKPAPANSVDAVLRKYEKERDTKETILVNTSKQIEDLGIKALKIEEQIAKLKETVSTTETELSQIDARRAADVSGVLAKLGVNLGETQPAESPSPQPELEFGSGINEDVD